MRFRRRYARKLPIGLELELYNLLGGMITLDPLGSRIANSRQVIPIENDSLKHLVNFSLRRRGIDRRRPGKEPFRSTEIHVGDDATSQRQCFKGDAAERGQHELIQHGVTRQIYPREIPV